MSDSLRRHRRVYLLMFAVLVLLPFGIVFAVMYQRDKPMVMEPLVQAGERTAADLREALGQVDRVLSGLLRATGAKCDDAALRLLRDPSFFHPLVRQAGLFDRNGTVTCTTWGPVSPSLAEPAMGLLPEERALIFRELGDDLILSRPTTTLQVPSTSIVASRRRPDGSGANLLLPPDLLGAYAETQTAGKMALGLLRVADGRLLASAGPEVTLAEGAALSGVTTLLEVQLTKSGDVLPAVAVPLSLVTDETTLDRADYAVLVVQLPDPDVSWTDGIMDAAARASLAGAVGLLSFLFILFLWRRRFSFEGEIKAAIVRDELFIEYQPIVDIYSGYCVAAEVLIRWQHPEKGRIRPDLFIDVAERTGLLTPMTDWLIKRVVLDMTDQSQGPFPNIRISINLAASHFRDRAFLERTHDRFRNAGINPRRITFELTERSVIDDENDADDSVWQAVNWLRERGYRISLDDFGTGYCNISQLQKFPIDYIKIDRSFVHRIESGQRAPLLDSIVNMARSINVPVIAEGVETDLHHHYLREMAVEFGQGYRYAKPLGVQWLRTLFAEVSPESRATQQSGPQEHAPGSSGGAVVRRFGGRKTAQPAAKPKMLAAE